VYVPSLFAERRPDVLHDFMRRNSFATLVVAGPDGIQANHLPFLLDTTRGAQGTLIGHVARANPVWRLESVPALVIFSGAHRYVSPSFYPSRRESGEVVPTWNYSVVHARGPLRFFEERERLRAIVTALTDEHERGRADPWRVKEAPPAFIDKMLGAIVGFELEVAELTGKFKASQNRTPTDRAGVVHGLELGTLDGAERDELVREPRQD
jgi:transcriptional regulator